MSFAELLMIAVGLSMDAFAVSICKGLSVGRVRVRHALLAGLYFGGFQFLMPVIGYLLGVRFQSLIESVDHWIAFFLLATIGAKMVRDAFGGEEKLDADLGFKTMLVLAVATSIDALAVGVTFAFLQVQLMPSATMIGVTTFLFSAAGMFIGGVFEARFQKAAEIAGGAILILIGLKILLEHLGLIAF